MTQLEREIKRLWSDGCIGIPTEDGGWISYHYEVKHYQNGSEFGIDGGRISKLLIWDNSTMERVAHYERGWEIKPEEGSAAEIALEILKRDYN